MAGWIVHLRARQNTERETEMQQPALADLGVDFAARHTRNKAARERAERQNFAAFFAAVVSTVALVTALLFLGR